MAQSARTGDTVRETIRIAVNQLDLDARNPRLVVPEGASQVALVTKLFEEESLDELVPSFLENGYFDEEPLVVVPRGKRFTVVEGNRRLATLKLLHDEKLRRQVRVGDWPRMTTRQKARLTRIPCVVYETRSDVLPFLGFRHITGAKKWAPFQRARFVSQLVDAGQSLEFIQEIIGDTKTSVTKKLYQEYVVFAQLRDELDFPVAAVRERFSLLEVMLGQRPIKRYLGMPAGLPRERITAPLVPDERIEALLEVTTWVFGDGDRQPVVGESRDINRLLAPVIANDEAREYLQRTNDLEGAYDRTDGEQKFLLRKLAGLERSLQDVAGLLPLYAGQDVMKEAVDRVVTIATSLRKQV